MQISFNKQDYQWNQKPSVSTSNQRASGDAVWRQDEGPRWPHRPRLWASDHSCRGGAEGCALWTAVHKLLPQIVLFCFLVLPMGGHYVVTVVCVSVSETRSSYSASLRQDLLFGCWVCRKAACKLYGTGFSCFPLPFCHKNSGIIVLNLAWLGLWTRVLALA